MVKASVGIIGALCLLQVNAQFYSGQNGQWGPPRGDSRCGPDFGMAGCQANECCSPAGFCGNTPAHCGGGGQMGYGGGDQMGYGMNQGGMIRDDGRCGSDFGAVCAPGLCCSPAGYCGDGPMYCGGGGYGGQNFGGGGYAGPNYGGGGYAGQNYGGGYGYNNQMLPSNGYLSGPPNGQWTAARDDGQCGPDYNWAGCYDGSCCGGDQYCGPQFC